MYEYVFTYLYERSQSLTVKLSTLFTLWTQLLGATRLWAPFRELISVRFADCEPMVHMLTVGAGVGELLEALTALEGFFSGVEPLVFGEMMLVLERFRALDALVWSLSCN